MLARFPAMLLIILAALPITVPFSTCALGDLFGVMTTRCRHEGGGAPGVVRVEGVGDVAAEGVGAEVRPEDAMHVAGPTRGPVLSSAYDVADVLRRAVLITCDRACLARFARPPSILRL